MLPDSVMSRPEESCENVDDTDSGDDLNGSFGNNNNNPISTGNSMISNTKRNIN